MRAAITNVCAALLPTIALGLVVACSGSSTSNIVGGGGDGGATDSASAADANGTEYTLDNVCAAVGPKICNEISSCCTSAGAFSESGCESHQLTNCQADVAEVKAGTMSFDPTKIDKCLTLFQPLYNQCFLGFNDLAKALPTLDQCHIWTGQRALGQPCDRDEQCAPATDPSTNVGCSLPTNGTQKVCSSLTFVAKDAACSFATGVTVFCSPGLYCDLGDGSANGTCQTATALGAPCNKSAAFNLECGFGAYCEPSTGVCTTGKAGGVTCANGIECASLTCNPAAGGTPQQCASVKAIPDAPTCSGP